MKRRFKTIGANLKQLKITYILQVKSIIEMTVLVWHQALTISKMERVQKNPIILGDKYTSCGQALSSLYIRKEKFCKVFAI